MNSAAKARVISTGYRPRPAQAELHREFKRFNVLVMHRRFGKTVLAVNEIIDRGLNCRFKNPQYMYIAPYYGQAKRVAWDYIKEYTKEFPGRHVHEGELRIDIPRRLSDGTVDRVRIMLMGADNPESLPGLYLDGVVLDEYGDMAPIVWSKYISPMLMDRGGWAIFMGTLVGKNHFWDLYHGARSRVDWYVSPDWMGDAYKTNILTKEDLEIAREAAADDDVFNEQYRSVPSGTRGAYYAKLIMNAEEDDPPRVTNVPFDPRLKTELFFDLGVGDAMSIWIIQVYSDKEYRAIDYIEDEGEGLEYYWNMILKQPYSKTIHRIVFPHDGAARSLGAEAKTRQEIMEELTGMHVEVLDRTPIADGIHAVRMILPKFWFDKTKCRRGLDALRNYTKVWDDKQQTFKDKPKHDQWSHGADAFRYVAMGLRDPGKVLDIKSIGRMMDNTYDPFAI